MKLSLTSSVIRVSRNKLLRLIIPWACVSIFGLLMLLSSGFLYLSTKLPSRESYSNIRLENPLRIFTRDGKLLAEFGSRRSDPIKYEDIPPLVVQALIASEDKRFYEHGGVDSLGLLRSVVGIITGRDWGGGSTLTMQVTKNFFFQGESAYSRKFKEILLALKMERELTKEEILELYFNRTFFGISAYGIKAAARQYYDKEVQDLVLEEVATLIGLLPRPNAYNPLQSRELAKGERSRVLIRMRDQSYITEDEFELAMNSPQSAHRYGRQPELSAPYLAELVRQDMMNRFGELALTDSYEVITTIDSTMQIAANAALEQGLESYDQRHGYRGPEAHFESQPELWEVELDDITTIAGQIPAVVTAVTEQNVEVLMKGGEILKLNWEGLRWAKRFITPSSWGSTPRNAAEILRTGDQVRVMKNIEGNWQLGQIPAVNGALVSMDPDNGALLALTGGYDFSHSSFNRATQARRQPGSNIKPFLYSAALDNGYTAASLINDAPLPRSDYRPSNFEGSFMGPIRLKYALAQSKNLVSLRLYDTLGADVVLPYFSKFGFKQEEFPRNDLTIAIGSHVMYPLEVVTGYSVFANGGYKVEPWYIQRITNFNDGVVFEAHPATVCEDCEVKALDSANAALEAQAALASSSQTLTNQTTVTSTNNETANTKASAAENPLLLTEIDTDTNSLPLAPRVLDARTAYLMNSILRSVITDGSGRPISRALNRQDLGGKTGTTNDNNDLWFSGFNKEIVTTVYVGYDEPEGLGRSEQAATVALPIWLKYMEKVLQNRPESTMPQPDGIVTVRINPETGLRANPDDPEAIFEVFKEETVPPYPAEGTMFKGQELDKVVDIF